MLNFENLDKANFLGVGKYDTPIIQPEHIDVRHLEWIPFDKALVSKDRATKGVHFYKDDYRFERFWNNPDKYISLLQQFGAVCSPDFSLYSDMPLAVQLFMHYKKHWLAAYWQAHGIHVIPTLCWCGEQSYDWCFDGEPRNAIVSISSHGTQSDPYEAECFDKHCRKALEEGVCFDGSSIAGFMHVEESDLVLRPDLSTVTILPWRPTEGRVMQFFCDVEKPDGAAFSGNCRGFLRDVNRKFKKLGLTCNVGTECEFYLFEKDDRGRPTCIPIDFGGYFDVAPLDAGENLRRDICLTMEQMGMAPQHSHHESGNGQNEIDCRYAGPLKTADNVMTFKQIVRAIAMRNGLHASFLPKPLPQQAGSGLHINLSLYMDGKNLFEGDIAPDSVAGSFMAGVLAHSRELTVFTNPLPNSYQRFGCDEAPRYVSWSRQNRSQLVRIPMVKGDSCRMELRSPDPACNPYLAIGLILAAGLDGIEQRMVLQPPVNRNLFDAAEAKGLGLETLPATLEEAVQVAEESEFLRKVLPEGLSKRYFSEELKRCAALRSAPDQAEHERVYYFNAI